MRPRRWNPYIAVFVLIVASLACSPFGFGGDGTQPEAQPLGAAEDELQALGIELPEPPSTPVLSSLQIEPSIAAVGDTLSITGDAGISGRVTLSRDGEAVGETDLANGAASFTIPAGASEGVLVAVLAGDQGEIAAGAARVAAEPALWLRADRRVVGEAEFVELRLEASGIPDSALAGLVIGEGDLAAALAVEADEEADVRAFLQPEDSGLLVPTFALRSTLADLAGRPLLLSGYIAGPVQAFAGDAEDGISFVSNSVSIQVCDQPGRIRGRLETRGAVRALALERGLETVSSVVEAGDFELTSSAGLTAVFAAGLSSIGEASEIGPVIVEVPCGGLVEVDLEQGTAEIIDRGLAPTESVDDEPDLLEDTGTLTFTGAVEGDYEVFPLCSLEEENGAPSLDVLFGFDAADAPLTMLTLTNFGESGSYSGEIQIDLFIPSAVESRGPVEAEVEVREQEFLQTASVTFRGSYSGAAGEGTIEGGFNCVIFGGSSDHGSQSSVAGGRGRPELRPATHELAAPLQQAGGAEPCRKIFVAVFTYEDTGDSFDSYLASVLHARLKRADILASSDIQALLGLEAQRQLLGADADSSLLAELAGALAVDFAVMGRFGTVPTTERSYAIITGFPYRDGDGFAQTGATGQPIEAVVLDQAVPEFVDEMADAALCPSVSPEHDSLEPGEELNVQLQVTNLADEPVEGADVEADPPDLGELDPQNGTTEGGGFEATYAADDDSFGTEELRFALEWSGRAGPVRVEGGDPGTMSQIEIGDSYSIKAAYSLNPDDPELGVLFEGGGLSLEAYACQRGKTGPYEGRFQGGGGVLIDALLLGLAPGESIDMETMFELPEEGGSFVFPSPFDTLEGRYLPDHNVVIIRSQGQPLMVGRIEALGREAACPP